MISMITRFLTIFITFLFTVPAFAQAPVPFEFGPRPPLSVFDPSGFLNPELVKEISDPLTTIYKNEGIDVLVVVLTDLKDAPPEHVAKRFAQAWCTSPIHCVVVHVPGRRDSPWIVPAGKLLDAVEPEKIRQAIEAGQSRAAREPKEPEKVRAAATEAADMLRYWTNSVANRTITIQTERTKMRARMEHEARLWRMGLLLAAASVIPLVVGISFLIVFLRRRGPRFFPNRAFQFRLGAPHAGGNHAVTKIGPLQL